MARVMIAEDAPLTRLFLRDLLHIGKHEVVAIAADGDETIEKFKAARPEMLLLDLAMPKKDGLTVLKKIMQIDPKAKVILITASGNLKTINECIAAGAVTYVLKPFKFEDLLCTIRATLSQ